MHTMLLVSVLLIGNNNMFIRLMLIHLQICRHFGERDHVRCVNDQLVAAGPKLLHHLWSHCDVLGNVSSDNRQTGQQHFIALDSVGHICPCRK